MSCLHQNNEKINFYKTNDIRRCSKCGIIFNANKPTHDYHDYYQSENGSRFNPLAETVVKIFRFKRALYIKFFCPKAKSILDIGSGRGYMLYYLRKYFGYQHATGTQISVSARNFSRDKLKLKIYGQDLLEIDFKEKFDIISLYHVLEHIQDTTKYLQKISILLNPDAKLIIQVPNYDSWSNLITRDSWLALDPQNHLYFFNYDFLRKILLKNGFRIISLNSFSLEYSIFTSTQSLINKLTNTNNLFFIFLQNKKFNPSIIAHIILFTLIFPLCLIINFIFYFSLKGENLNIIAKKI